MSKDFSITHCPLLIPSSYSNALIFRQRKDFICLDTYNAANKSTGNANYGCPGAM